jgi:hypothetical protein
MYQNRNFLFPCNATYFMFLEAEGGSAVVYFVQLCHDQWIQRPNHFLAAFSQLQMCTV